MHKTHFDHMPVATMLQDYPFMAGFFTENHLEHFMTSHKNYITLVAEISDIEAEEWAIDKKALMASAYTYFVQMRTLLGLDDTRNIEQLTILPGFTKSKEQEGFEAFTITPGEIIAIVGPTGSGKSRLLADIEWTADGDTPTKRRIQINGATPDKKWRFNSSNPLVAQLSQNMNFVMDLTVEEFVSLHAASRMTEDIDNVVGKILDEANHLAGEPFSRETPITSLSGGQSRALMIADTAILSQSPIVLIDEIENAGIDRKKALKLLVSKEKIVLIATHDPILALMADKRIIIKNGGIDVIIETTENEKALLSRLETMDAFIQEQRGLLRTGHQLH